MVRTTPISVSLTAETDFLLVNVFTVGHYGYGKSLLIVIQGAKAVGSLAIFNLLVITPQGKEGSAGP